MSDKQIPSTLLDCIKTYADAGYATFPTQGNKQPMRGIAWLEAPIEREINAFKYASKQFGVVLKSDDLIVDIDPRNMGDRQVWTELKTLIPELEQIEKEATLVRTGNKGIHIYLRKPSDIHVHKRLAKFPGVEFLSKGCYVIGAGSIVQGRPYHFLNMPFYEVPAPMELIQLIQKTEQVIDSGEYAHKGFNDTEENIARYTDYLIQIAPVAVEGEHGDTTTYQVACQGRDYNLSTQKTLELMSVHYNPRCKPPWGQKELETKVRNAYTYAVKPPGTNDPKTVLSKFTTPDVQKWRGKIDVCADGKTYKKTLRNCVLCIANELEIKGRFIYNLFNERLEIKGHVPWEHRRVNRYNILDDREIECIRLHLVEKFNVEFSTPTVWKAVDLVAAGNFYHPICDEVNSYEWDGIERIDTWLINYCGVQDTPLHREIGCKVLCAMIARVYDPGCKFDYVLVLEGAQGIGKSTCCEILGGQWYGDAPIDTKDKDTIPYIHSKWVVELSEMITTRKTEADRLKNFISRREDDVRLPYARARQRFPRQCIFIGTINPDDMGYLNDPTGNRRFWPVSCSGFDLEGLRRDRNLLLAEAKIRYEQKESLTLSPHVYQTAEREVKERLSQDPWQEHIQMWMYEHPEVGEVTTPYIFCHLLGGHMQNMNTGHLRRIGVALANLGWTKNRRNNGTVYLRPIRPDEGDSEC